MSNNIKRILFLSLSLAILLTGCSSNKKGIIAVVNGEEITIEEYNKELEIYKAFFVHQNGKEFLYEEVEPGKTYESKLKRDVLDKLILEKIIEQDFIKSGLVITDDELAEYIDEMIGDVKEEFIEVIDEIGVSWQEIERLEKNELMINKHKAHYFETIEIEEKLIDDYYRNYKDMLIKYRISEIFLEDEQKAFEVLNRIKNGESFEKIAEIESKNSISAIHGGDIGFVKGGINPFFDDYIKKLEIGEISDVIIAPDGYYIIKLTDKLETLEELREDIVQELKKESYIAYVTMLKDESKIKDYYDYFN